MAPTKTENSARYIPAAQVTLLLDKAEAMGLNADTMLRQSRLSVSVAELRSGSVRHVAISDFAKLGQICYEEMRRATLQHGMSREDFNLLCHALVTSVTLREVIERQMRFFEICGRRFGWFELRETDTRVAVEIHLGPIEQCWAEFFILNAFMVFGRLFDWLIGGSLNPRFHIAGSRNEETNVIAAICSLRIAYNSGFDGISFDADRLDRPVVRDGVEMREFLQAFPFDVFIAADTEVDLSTHVAAAYRDAILKGRSLPDLGFLAASFNMADATFRRHLESEGTSTRRIKDRVRFEVAADLLKTGNLHLEQIAILLGFSSAKAITRAFMKWSGETPTAYRQRHLRRHATEDATQGEWARHLSEPSSG